MRKRKDGTFASFDPDVWRALAESHREHAQLLRWFLSRSTQRVSGLARDDDASAVDTFTISRWKSEASAEAELADEEPSSAAVELRAIHLTLAAWSDRHLSRAQTCDELQLESSRPGRKRIVKHVDNALLALTKATRRNGRKLGRPRRIDIDDSGLLSLLKDGHLAGWKARQTLDYVVKKWLELDGKHTAGSVVARFRGNLEKRLSAARNRVIRK